MSERYFHLDRRGELSVGDELGRTLPDVGTAEARALLSDCFNGGLSPHGEHYCAMDLYGADDADLWDVGCELTFELVRRDRFPDRPSRLQSVFGFAERAAAERFAEKYGEGTVPVYEISGTRTFEGDMRMVDAPHLPGTVRRAHYYWEGTTDREDPLWETLLSPPVVVERAAGTVTVD